MRVFAVSTSLLLAAALPAQLTCTVTSGGESCGPQLTVTYQPVGGAGNQRIDLTATGLHPNALTILAWGDAPAYVPLGGGCLLLHNFIWNELHISDATGSFSWGRTWPHYIVNSYYMQMGSIALDSSQQLEILTTNCKIGTCQ